METLIGALVGVLTYAYLQAGGSALHVLALFVLFALGVWIFTRFF